MWVAKTNENTLLDATASEEEIREQQERENCSNNNIIRLQFEQPYLTETSYLAHSLGVNDVDGYVASGLLFYRKKNDDVEALFAWESPWDTYKRRYDKPSFNLIGGKRESIYEWHPHRTATRVFYQSLANVMREDELPDWREVAKLAKTSQKLWIPYGKYCLCCIDITNKDDFLPLDFSDIFARRAKEYSNETNDDATPWAEGKSYPWGLPKYQKQIQFLKWVKIKDLVQKGEVSDLVRNLKSLETFRTIFHLPRQTGNTPKDISEEPRQKQLNPDNKNMLFPSVFNDCQQRLGVDSGLDPMRQQQLSMGYGINPFAYQQQLCVDTGINSFPPVNNGINPFPPLEQFGMSDGMLPFPFLYPQFNLNMFAHNGNISHNRPESSHTNNRSHESLLDFAGVKRFPQETSPRPIPPPPESLEAVEYVRRVVLHEKNIPPVLAKQWLGELIYVRVEKEIENDIGDWSGRDAYNVGKITGMLLEMDNHTLFNLIDNYKELQKNVKQAQEVLCENGDRNRMESRAAALSTTRLILSS
eukprot:GEMP01039727.1.p1 GENE.GEMP01039727.1~~GEMP01039727.1.p1  ORF type:complete len:530 (+),score=89.35 GEMP01039727.1:54-1643(+)